MMRIWRESFKKFKWWSCSDIQTLFASTRSVLWTVIFMFTLQHSYCDLSLCGKCVSYDARTFFVNWMPFLLSNLWSHESWCTYSFRALPHVLNFVVVMVCVCLRWSWPWAVPIKMLFGIWNHGVYNPCIGGNRIHRKNALCHGFFENIPSFTEDSWRGLAKLTEISRSVCQLLVIRCYTANSLVHQSSSSVVSHHWSTQIRLSVIALKSALK